MKNSNKIDFKRLSEVSKVVVQAAPEAKRPDAVVPIDRIFSVTQVRKIFVDIDVLAEDIKQNGLIQPLVVTQEPDGRHRIIVGERRFRACQQLGLKEVGVLIRNPATPLELRRLQVSENEQRNALTAYEQALGVCEDLENFTFDETVITWGKGKSWVSKRGAFARYAEPVKALLINAVCEDFEVLHTLNQIIDTGSDGAAQFQKFEQQFANGEAVSRDAVRTALSLLKNWENSRAQVEEKREQEKLASSAVEAVEADDTADLDDLPSEAPASAPAAAKAKAKAKGDSKPVPAAKNKAKPAPVELLVTLSAEEQAKEKAQAAKLLQSLRADLFEWGDAYPKHIEKMFDHIGTAKMDMQHSEWVLWQGFAASMLPLLQSLGKERTSAYLKKLAVELKHKEPTALWTELHRTATGEPDTTPPCPENWRL